jgi:flagellar biosynthesis protein FlhB
MPKTQAITCDRQAMSDKPLPPSPKRLRDARNKGDVPRSEPLVAWIVMALCFEAIFACLGLAHHALLQIMQATLARLRPPYLAAHVAELVWQCARFFASALGIVVGIAVLAAIIGAWASGSLHFAPMALKPSAARLHPLNHVKQMFSQKHLVTIVIALATALVVGVVGYAALMSRFPIFSAMIQWRSVEHSWQASIDALQWLLRILLAALIVPALVSALTAKRSYLRKLRMSYREAKDEHKQTTGDPFVRARQRAARHEAAAAPPTPKETTGCVLVMNPEHLAVLLYYGADERSAPIMLDKGADAAAWQMADSAHVRDIPRFRFKKLTRHLYEHGEINAMIPPECYRAVAIVYRLVEEMQSLGARPSEPIDIDDAFFDD